MRANRNSKLNNLANKRQRLQELIDDLNNNKDFPAPKLHYMLADTCEDYIRTIDNYSEDVMDSAGRFYDKIQVFSKPVAIKFIDNPNETYDPERKERIEETIMAFLEDGSGFFRNLDPDSVNLNFSFYDFTLNISNSIITVYLW